MALRFIDGFDHYATADIGIKYDAHASAISTAGRRDGSSSMKLLASEYIRKTLDDQSTWIVGFAFKAEAYWTSNVAFVRFYDNTGAIQATVATTPEGKVALYRGDMSALLATSVSTPLPVNTWYFVETKIFISDSTGTFEVKVNGTSVVSYTGDTKQSGSLSTANSIRINQAGTGSSTSYVDDLYICDATGGVNNTFLGDCRVDALRPTGAGASSQFTPSGGANNWDNVNDVISDNDTTYNYADTAASTDTFTFEELSASATIHGIQVNMVARKDDVGARTLAATAVINSTGYDGSAKTLASTYINHAQIWEVNPNSAGAWTDSALNGAEFGYKVVA